MRCKDVHKEIFDLIDGVLSSERSDEISGHIESCDECSKYLGFIEGVSDEMEHQKSEQPSDAFDIRLMAELDKPSISTISVFRRVFTPIATAAIILFGIFTGIRLGEYSSGSRADTNAELPSEYYYANEIHLEPIEGFFLQNEARDEEE